LLLAAYANTKTEMIAELQKQKECTLFIDGSADGCQDPITHIVAAVANKPPFFIKEIPHLHEPHNVENTMKIVNHYT
jgi:hypothetical protein